MDVLRAAWEPPPPPPREEECTGRAAAGRARHSWRCWPRCCWRRAGPLPKVRGASASLRARPAPANLQPIRPALGRREAPRAPRGAAGVPSGDSPARPQTPGRQARIHPRTSMRARGAPGTYFPAPNLSCQRWDSVEGLGFVGRRDAFRLPISRWTPKCASTSVQVHPAPKSQRSWRAWPEGSLYFQGCLRESVSSEDRLKQKLCPPGARAASHLHGARLAGLLEGHDGGHNVCAAAAATLCKMCCQACRS